MRNFPLALVFCSLTLLLLSGCGSSEHGYVSGVVKINGEAVEGAFVTFTPVEGGRQATAITDADGSYELQYTPGVKGAKLGTNTVKISTFESPALEDDGTVTVEGSPELFPPEYSSSSSVTVDVQKGKNTFDFDVEATQDSYQGAEDQ